MKKLFIALAAVLLLCGVTSCDKENENNALLYGTQWMVKTDDGTRYDVIFGVSQVTLSIIPAEENPYLYVGLFDYDPPTVSMDFGNSTLIKGYIVGDEMTLSLEGRPVLVRQDIE